MMMNGWNVKIWKEVVLGYLVLLQQKLLYETEEDTSVVIANRWTEIRSWYFKKRYRHADEWVSNTGLYAARFVIGFVRGPAFGWGVNNCHDNLISHIEVNAKWSM